MAIHDPTPQQLWAHITQQPMKPATEVETWRPYREGHSMTPADIERLAREAEFTSDGAWFYADGPDGAIRPAALARFAELVRASEREAVCAFLMLMDAEARKSPVGHNYFAHAALRLRENDHHAAAIRAMAAPGD